MKLLQRRRELLTRATPLRLQRAKAFPRKQSFFSILKRVAVCLRLTIPTCALGPRNSRAPVIVPAPIVLEYPSKKGRALRSQPRATFALIRLHRASSFSSTTIGVRPRPAAHFLKIRRPRQRAEFPTPRFGNSRNLRAAW